MTTSSVCHRRLGEYELGPKLGSGKFAKVRIAKKAGEADYRYAVKYMKIGAPYSKASLAQILREENAQASLTHPNLLRLYESSVDGLYEKVAPSLDSAAPQPMAKEIPVAYAVLQLARTGDLFDFLTSLGGLPEPIARYFFIQLLNAVEFMHNSGLAHRDLKPENLLLDADYNILLSDFGFCKRLAAAGPLAKFRDRVGTERYMSPELYAKKPYSPVLADLFALGVILFMFVACHPPFTLPSDTESEHYKFLKDHKENDYWKAINALHKGTWCSQEFMHLMTLMLQYEPSLRPSLSEIRTHPWVLGEVATEAEVRANFEQRQARTFEMKREEAKKRKAEREQKQAQHRQEEEKEKAKQKAPFSGHVVYRSADVGFRSGPHAENARKLPAFGTLASHKPTVLISQESPATIESEFIAFFQSALHVDVFTDRYKVPSEYFYYP